MGLPPIFERYRDAIEGELRAFLSQRKAPLYQMVLYQMGWIDDKGEALEGGGGKRIRPVLCLLSCEALSGDYHRALPAAAAVELVHNFSLVHDDIQDGSPQRRQRPSVWWVWGPAQAINAGDGLHALGRLALFRLEEKGVPPPRLLRAIQLLDETCLRLCEGQYLDLAYQERLDVGMDAYLEMVKGKTGALMGCAMALGALVATDDPRVQEAFSLCGTSLGIAFQIRDDILDLWGEGPDKPVGGDLLNKKKSLPVIYALERGSPEVRRELDALYLKPSLEPRDVERIVEILEGLGAEEYAQGLAHQYYQRALEALSDLGLPSWGLEEIGNVGRFLIQREK
jgi:geranylgeranyl diphosphate synthase type I